MQIIYEQRYSDLVMRKGFWNKGQSKFHWHENIEIIYITKNTMNFLVDGCPIEASKGDIVVIDAHTIHCFDARTDGIELNLLQLNPKLLLNADFNLKPVKVHIKSEDIESDPVFHKRITALLDIIGDGVFIKHGEKNPFFQAIFSAIYIALMMKFPKQDFETAPKKEKKEFYKIVEYINNNFKEDITVQSIAQELFMSRGKVSRVFTKYSGENINSYINTIRVNNVNQLLDSGKDITEASYESGFQTIRTFNNIYKKVMNVTPSEYLRKCKK